MPTDFDLKCTLCCNSDCVHCVIGDLRRGIPLRERHPTLPSLMGELEEQHGRGAISLTLTGGEPTVRDDLPVLVAHARRTGYAAVHLQTNARLCCRNGLAGRLAEAGLSTAAVPLLGATPDIHDSLSRRRGSFDQAVRGIEALIGTGVQVWGRTVILRYNLAQLDRICALFLELGASGILISFPRIDRTMEQIRIYEELVPRYTELRPTVARLRGLLGLVPLRFEGMAVLRPPRSGTLLG